MTATKPLNRKNRRKNRLSKGDKRQLTALIRKHGSAGARKVWEKLGNGYVSGVTVWKLAKIAGIEQERGRPKTEEVKTFKRFVRSIVVE